jgi:hypothetical protein
MDHRRCGSQAKTRKQMPKEERNPKSRGKIQKLKSTKKKKSIEKRY